MVLPRVLNVLTEIFQALSDSVHHIRGTPTENHEQALESRRREDMKEVTELLGSYSDNFLVEFKRT